MRLVVLLLVHAKKNVNPSSLCEKSGFGIKRGKKYHRIVEIPVMQRRMFEDRKI